MVSDRSNGIYRGIVVAIVGLILIGAAPNKDGINQGDQSASQKAETDQLKAIVTAIKEATRPPQPDKGCKAGKDDRSSDLCAQWKAADAASDAAWWTFFAAVTTVVGVIVGGFTLVAAGFAACYAKQAATAASVGASAAIDAVAATNKANLLAMKANARATRQAVASARETAKALEIAERNADAATRQVEVSKQSAERQLRPYVYIEKILPKKPSQGFKEVEIHLKNFGQTPAPDLKIRSGFGLCTKGAAHWPLPNASVRLGRDIAPGHFQKAIVGFDFGEDKIRPLIDGLIEMHITFIVEYAGFGINGFDKLSATIIYTSQGARVDPYGKEGNVI